MTVRPIKTVVSQLSPFTIFEHSNDGQALNALCHT